METGESDMDGEEAHVYGQAWRRRLEALLFFGFIFLPFGALRRPCCVINSDISKESIWGDGAREGVR